MNRSWIELDGEALLHNLKIIKERLDPGTKMMAVVKANGYGCGICRVATFLEAHGIRHFAVATIEEAIELRKAGISSPVLVLGGTAIEYVRELIELRITQALVTIEYAEELNKAAEAYAAREGLCPEKAKVLVHMAIDTGMHRIGAGADQADEIAKIYRLPYLDVKGCFTHLCAADSNNEDDVNFTKGQIAKYFAVVEALKAKGIDLGLTHIQNSYSCFNYTPQPCDYARPGILMYGALSSRRDYLCEDPGFMPVLSLKVRISSVREINEGETVGYGRTYKAESKRKIATVGIGYGDGIPRNLSGGKLEGLVKGMRIRGTGRVCMDQTMFDVTDVPGVKAGDIVTLIGKDGDEEIRVEEVAEAAGTITNEFLCRLGRRIENLGFTKAGDPDFYF
ncbi:MAG: alanine racemase [Firmicutes bacterium]|nr:alanine racemase [Bacillota bacterium]